MTTGHGPLRSGWQMKVSIGPPLASMSTNCSITMFPQCSLSAAVGQPVGLLRVDHGDHAHAAAFAVRPAPWERHEGAALAGHRVELAAHILDSRNTVAHENFVRRLPMGKIVEDVAAGGRPVFSEIGRASW